MATIQEMHTLVVYDIEDDKCRTRISNACLDFGLQRFQKSCFWGKLNTNRRKELFHKLKDKMGDSPGRILLQQISEDDVTQRLVFEQKLEGASPSFEPADPAKSPPIIQRF